MAEHDAIVRCPGRAEDLTDLTDVGDRTTVDRHLLELLTGEKRDPSAVGREERLHRALRAFENTRRYVVQRSGDEMLDHSRADGDVDDLGAVRRQCQRPSRSDPGEHALVRRKGEQKSQRAFGRLTTRQRPRERTGSGRQEGGREPWRKLRETSTTLHVAEDRRGRDDRRWKRDRLALKRFGEFMRRVPPIRGQLLQRAVERRVHVRRNVRPHESHASRMIRENLGDDGLRGARGVRRVAAQHLVQNRGEGIDVGALVDRPVARGLLRRHVVRRAE